MDQDGNQIIFETLKSEIILDEKGSLKRIRPEPKVYTDPSFNLIHHDPPNDVGDTESVSVVDVDAYIVSEPSNIRPWLCQLCLTAGARNPYRSMHKHNLKYHIIRKHFKMEIPKNWQVWSFNYILIS